MPRPRDLVVFTGSVGAIGLVTAALRTVPNLSPATAALALLLVVVGASTLARLRTGISVSLVAALALNFFFLPPLGTLTIADPQHWITWLTFLVVAAIASKLSAAALVREKAELTETLLASLSHDLRTPLTAIRLAVENLRGDLPTAERGAQAAAAIAELERLTRLFEDILDMARIDAEAIPIKRQWVTAADVVDAAVAHVRHAVDGHALHVDADDVMEVEIDPRLTSVAVSHLIENAARYSPAEKPIIVRARVAADGLHISVIDQGPGLADGEAEHLFERFYRGRAGRQFTAGTGMGLSITRGLLAATGGRVRAETAPGAGAHFSVVVPGAVRPSAVPA